MKDDKEKSGKNAVEENLKKQFQDLKTEATVPEDLKKEVFNTLDTLTLFSDVMDLFTAKFSESEAEFIDLIGNSNPVKDNKVVDNDQEKPEQPPQD